MKPYEAEANAKIDACMESFGWDLADRQGALECLLTDLRHWARMHRVSFKVAIAYSREKHKEERPI